MLLAHADGHQPSQVLAAVVVRRVARQDKSIMNVMESDPDLSCFHGFWQVCDGSVYKEKEEQTNVRRAGFKNFRANP